MPRSAFLGLTLLLVACSGTAVGTGGTGGAGDTSTGGGSSGSSTSSDTTSGGTSDPAASAVDFDKLFGAPSSTSLTPDSIAGLWAGTVGDSDVRLKVTATSLTVALRCSSSSRAVGVEVAARIGAEGIRILESKVSPNDGSQPYCRIDVKPVVIPVCTAGTYAYECAGVKGTTLKIGPALFTTASSSYRTESEYTKLSD